MSSERGAAAASHIARSRITRLLAAARAMLSAPGRKLALILLVSLVAVRMANALGLETLGLRGFDLEQRIAPRPAPPASPVVIVAIDDRSISRRGQWPWPRTWIAQLVGRIADEKPRVLGVDIIFSERDRTSPDRLKDDVPTLPPSIAKELQALPPNEVALADALGQVSTVLGVDVSDKVSAEPPPGPLRVTPVRQTGPDPRVFLQPWPHLERSVVEAKQEPGEQILVHGHGALTVPPDRDGVFRRVPLFILGEGKLVPTLALEMVRVASGSGYVLADTTPRGIRGVTTAGIFMPTDIEGRAYPYFRRGGVPTLSAADLLEHPEERFGLEKAFVLLGVTAQALGDQRQTPLGVMSGVEVHAQLLESMLFEDLLRRPPVMNSVEIITALVTGLLVVFALPYQRPRTATAVFVSIVVLVLGSEFVAFRLFRLLLDGTFPAISVAVTYAVMLGSSLRAAEAARRKLAAELAHEREMEARLEGEINAARAIQMGLLPRRFPGPPERRDVEVYAFIEPARTVGGDLYDFQLLDSHRLSFAIADVSGEGVAAALFMAMSREVLHAATLRHGDALDRAFAEANEKISAASAEMAAQGGNMMFLTVFAGVLDLRSGAVVCASAGHDSPFLLRAGAAAVRLATEGGPPLGTVDDFQYPVERHQLQAGDLLLLYTDGVTEAQDPAHTFYASHRLEQLLGAAEGASNPQAVVEQVREDVRRFVAGAEQADDLTLLAVQWTGADGAPS